MLGVTAAVAVFLPAVLPGVFWRLSIVAHPSGSVPFGSLADLRLPPLLVLVFALVAVFGWMVGVCYFLILSRA